MDNQVLSYHVAPFICFPQHDLSQMATARIVIIGHIGQYGSHSPLARSVIGFAPSFCECPLHSRGALTNASLRHLRLWP